MKIKFEMMILTWLAMLVFVSMAIVSSTLDPLVRERFADIPRATSIFMTVHSLPQLLLIGIVFGFFSDRLRKRYPLIMPSMMITGICTALLPIIDHFPTLIAVRFIDGTSGIIAIGLIMAKILDIADRSGSKGKALGLFLFCIPMGYLVAMGLTFYLSNLGLQNLFFTVGLTIFFSSFLLIPHLFKDEQISESDLALKDFFRSFKRVPRLWPALLFSFADKFTFAAIAMLTSLVMVDIFEISDVEAIKAISVALALYFSGFLVFSAISGIVTDKFGSKRVVLIGSSIYAIALIILPDVSHQWFLILMFIAGGLTAFQFVPTLDMLRSLSLPNERGVNTQLFNFAGSVGFLLGFPILGIASGIDGSYQLAYGIAGGIELLAVIIAGSVFFFQRRKPSNSNSENSEFPSNQQLPRSVS